VPAPIYDQERPYYPQMVTIIDHADGVALYAGLAEEKNASETLAGDILLDILMKMEHKPRRLLVKQRRLFVLLEQLCEQSGIELRFEDRLPKIAEFRQGLREYAQR